MTASTVSKPSALAAAPAIHILDVGHGNAALVIEPGCISLIDAAHGITVLKALRTIRTEEACIVSNVILSHTHDDHISGVIQVLLADDISVGRVHLKPDSFEGSKRFEDLRRGLGDARARGSAETRTDVSRGAKVGEGHSFFAIDVLSPTGEQALGLRRAIDGSAHDPNALSSVLRVSANGNGLVLFAGDIDNIGLDHLLEAEPAPTATVLVFPHHGGSPGAKPREFAERLTSAVKPDVVVFSNGRRRFRNPLPSIVDGVRAAAPGAQIMCTQLSRTCMPNNKKWTGLMSVPSTSKGASTGDCCAGTISIAVDARSGTGTIGARGDHRLMVSRDVPNPLCLV